MISIISHSGVFKRINDKFAYMEIMDWNGWVIYFWRFGIYSHSFDRRKAVKTTSSQ